MGKTCIYLGALKEAKLCFQDSLATFRTIDDDKETLRGVNSLARICFLTSQFNEGLEHLDYGLRIAQKNNDLEEIAVFAGNLGLIHRKRGNFEEARDYLKLSLKSYQKIGNDLEISRCLISEGRLLFTQRLFEKASRKFKSALDLGLKKGFEREIAMTYESSGDLARERNELEKAKDYYQKALDIGRKLAPQGDLVNQVQRRRAEFLLMEGQNLEASECCEEALKISQALRDRLEEGCCYRVQALIHEAQGNLKGAGESFEKAIKILESIEDKFELGRALLEEGRFIACALKQRDRGLDLLQNSAQLFAEIGPGCEYYIGSAKTEMAKAKLLISHPDEAQILIDEAEAIFLKLDAREALKETAKLRSQVERLLREAINPEENSYLLLKELSLKPPSEAGLRNHLKKLVLSLNQRVGANEGFVAYRDTKGLKVIERVKLREEEAEKALSLLAADPLEPGELIVKLSAAGKFSSLNVGALLVMPLGLKGRLDGLLYLAKKPGRGGWRRDDVNFFVGASEHISKLVSDLRVECLEAETLVLRAYEVADRCGFPRLITTNQRMKEVLRKVDKVKDVQEPILLTGETGTGKELIARLIHYSGQRALEPFITVDCASIAETLLEDELYGHMKGAFTGATRERRGKFEEANGGSIFLDEISTLRLDLQAKFLRILQEGEVQRIGDNRWRKVDVRVIAATNKDLQAEVKAGGFRKDVFYRLNCFVVELPPLRRRKGDIPLLVEHFIRRSCRDNKGKQIKGVSPEAMEMLMRYEWPGNVRELKNLINSAVIFADDGDVITPDLVEVDKEAATRETEGGKGSLKDKVGVFERDLIKVALAEFSGNRTKTAEFLGLSRRGLQKKLVKYNIKDKM